MLINLLEMLKNWKSV